MTRSAVRTFWHVYGRSVTLAWNPLESFGTANVYAAVYPRSKACLQFLHNYRIFDTHDFQRKFEPMGQTQKIIRVTQIQAPPRIFSPTVNYGSESFCRTLATARNHGFSSYRMCHADWLERANASSRVSYGIPH